MATPELTEIENGFFAALLYPAIACAAACALFPLAATPLVPVKQEPTA